ncbi:hypothetical protein OU5_5852 [Pseudomonas mandelii JR-1]|uniref:Uncharacterized protein n=1 Tax=Pseudomonas mandelii JR-1 TaxID=1147786 RepID=A0A024EJZ7_9PSED|nr:hypothetical protein OU5_5852 [Pseudomonas mandelii JR-1]
MSITLHQQAVTFDVGQACSLLITLAEQVACRVMGETFRRGATNVDQPVERVVMIATIAFSAVIDAGEVTVGIVSVATLEQVAILLVDAMSLQAALFIVLVLAEQQTLLKKGTDLFSLVEINLSPFCQFFLFFESVNYNFTF